MTRRQQVMLRVCVEYCLASLKLHSRWVSDSMIPYLAWGP
jgi:hypothetical protein